MKIFQTLILAFISLLVITACQTPTDEKSLPTAAERKSVETHLRTNLPELSPVEPVLGGTWYLTTIHFPTSGEAIIDYEDGHIAQTAEIAYTYSSGDVDIDSFIIADDQPLDKN